MSFSTVSDYMKTQSHRDLVVWQRAMELIEEIYRLTERFPSDEKFGLVSQMRRAAVSIPSNIAEGFRRLHRPEYRQFLSIARGSGAELETQLEISRRLFTTLDYSKAENLVDEVMRMLYVMIERLHAPRSTLHAPPGFAALLIILIIMSVAVAIGVGFTTFGLSDLQVGFVQSQSAEAFAAADSCMNESLIRLRRDWYYAGGTLALGGSSCTITVSGTSPTTRLVSASSTVGAASRAIRASVTLISSGVVSSTLWEEY